MTSPNVGGPSRPVSGYEQVHTAGSRFGQDLSEEKIRSLLGGRAINPFDKFLKGLTDGIANALRGVFTPGSLFANVGQAALEIKDGQLELNNRQDLIDNLLNYGSCFNPTSPVRNPDEWFKVNFTAPIGAMRNVEILPEGGLRLKKAGLWDIRSQIVSGSVTGLAERYIIWNVEVKKPNGERHSVQVGRITGRSPGHSTIVSSVMVPGPNYTVEVYVKSQNFGGQVIGYGPAHCRLTAQQINSNTVEGNTGAESSGIEGV